MTSPRRSLILDVVIRVVFDGAWVLAAYLLFAGHNRPGGGFVGGLVAAGAIALRYLAGGRAEVTDALRVPPWGFLAAGLGLVAATAAVPLLLDRAPLDHGSASWDLPLVGAVKVTSALPFDTGVLLIVVGLMLMLVEGLGERGEEPPLETEEAWPR